MTSLQDAMHALEQANEHLVGGRIVGTVSTNPKSEELFSYGLAIVVKGKKYVAWLDCDPEGNGPGFLSIQPFQERI